MLKPRRPVLAMDRVRYRGDALAFVVAESLSQARDAAELIDLDVETLELLEELLCNYDGTLILVSHDRTFLDNVVTSTLAFEGDGNLQGVVATAGM